MTVRTFTARRLTCDPRSAHTEALSCCGPHLYALVCGLRNTQTARLGVPAAVSWVIGDWPPFVSWL